VTHYNALGQADWTENAADNRTAYGYDALGRQNSETDALTNTVHTAYDSLGNVVSTWGAAYPVESGYDSQGRKVSMKTFRNEEGAGDETRWFFDHATGLLTNKVYADGMGTAYTYTPDGKPATRVWARGVETAYSYDAFGSPIGVDYSDSTPDVTYAYDRLGRVVSAISAVSTNLFAYDGLNLATETQNGVTINRTTDNLGRQAGFGLGADYAVQYGYDEFGRFTSITSTVLSVSSVTAYSRLDGSGQIASMTNSAGFFWSRTYEQQRNLIASVENRFGENLISQFDYTNDELGRRMQRVDDSVVTNDFGYNYRSELVEAAMNTNSYGYIYDDIGNREWAQQNAATNLYLSNPLNQYTNIADGAILEPEYDADGNMTATRDGWRYVWNGENRLILASNSQHVVTYAYDHQGRMVAKTVNGSARQYLWDGYNIVQETIANQQSAITNAFTWGMDLSGTLQGAGGVGGLLAVTHSDSSGSEPYFPCTDGNGNICQYVDTSGTVVAAREYNPFGRTIALTGDKKDDFTHWFSTKPLDSETGLVLYELRPYEPDLGRFLSQDPIEELGGFNLYAFVGNNPINSIDLLGLEESDLMTRLKALFPKDGTIDDFISGVDQVISRVLQAPGGNWALYQLIAREGDFTQDVQRNLLKNYMALGGKSKDPYKMTVDEVIASNIEFSLLDDAQVLEDLRAARQRLKPGGTDGFKGTYNVPAKAWLTATLGQFTAVADTTVTCVLAKHGRSGSWVAVGTFKVKDRYDFDYDKADAEKALQAYLKGNLNAGPFQGRSVLGQLKTVIMSRVGAGGYGAAFDVTSEDVPFEQRSGDKKATIKRKKQ
jgi:RHS repeat-associated protein